MPPRGIPCSICGGMFFASSLKIHQKQCAAKYGARRTVCVECNADISMLDLKSHLSQCSGRKRVSTTSRSNIHTLREGSVSQGPITASTRSNIHTLQEIRNDESDGNDALIPCRHCSRTFALDRIQKHMMICSKLKKRRQFDVVKQRMPTDATGYSIVPRKMQKPAPANTNWRVKSADFRAAAQGFRAWEAEKAAQRPSLPRPGSQRQGASSGKSGGLAPQASNRYSEGLTGGRVLGGARRPDPNRAFSQDRRTPGVAKPSQMNGRVLGTSSRPSSQMNNRIVGGPSNRPSQMNQVCGTANKFSRIDVRKRADSGASRQPRASAGGWGRQCAVGGGGTVMNSNESSAGNPFAMGR